MVRCKICEKTFVNNNGRWKFWEDNLCRDCKYIADIHLSFPRILNLSQYVI